MELMLQPEVNTTRKERERLARRDDILTAAQHVFSERGFDKAKLEEIAEIAELGKGTIYNYFKSKEELFVHVIMQGIKSFQVFTGAAVETQATPTAKIAAYIDAAFAFFENHRQLFSIYELERSNLARSLNQQTFAAFCEREIGLLQYLEQLFFEGIKSGEFKKLDAAKMAQTLFGAIHFTTTRWIHQYDGQPLQEEAAFLKKSAF